MHTNFLKKAALSLFLLVFAGIYWLEAQNLESEVLKTQQETEKNSSAKTEQELPFSVAYDSSLTSFENQNRQSSHWLQVPPANSKDSLEQTIYYLNLETRNLVNKEESRIEALDCEKKLRWLKELDEYINKTPRDTLFEKFVYDNELINYNYSNSIMEINIFFNNCSFDTLPFSIKNIEAAERQGWLRIDIMIERIGKMEVDPLPGSPEEAAQNLLENIEKILNIYGKQQNDSFAKYMSRENQKKRSLYDLIVFRRDSLRIIINKL